MYENITKEIEAIKKELDRLSKYEFIGISSLCKPNQKNLENEFHVKRRAFFLFSTDLQKILQALHVTVRNQVTHQE